MKARLLIILCFLVVFTLTLSVPSGVTAQPAALAVLSSQQLGLGAERQVSTSSNPETNRYHPAAAYNGASRQTLVVWHRNNGSNLYYIEGRLLDAAGKPLGSGPTIFASGGTPVYQPAVAYNAVDHQYLVVWMRNTLLDGKTYAIWGKILYDNLTEARPEYEIFSPPANFSCWTPRVAWNAKSTEYQVAWNTYNIIGWPSIIPDNITQETLVYYGDLVGHILVIGNKPGNMIYPSDIDLVYANDYGGSGKYLWVWSQVKPGTAERDIWAANIDASLGGYLPSLPPFKIDDSSNEQAYPRIATNGNNDFMVVWQERSPVSPYDWDIRGREINQIGTLLGDAHYIAGSANVDETSPFVAGWPGTTPHYVVGYERDIKVTGEVIGQGVWLGYYNDGANVLDIPPNIFWMDEFAAADYAFYFNSTPTGVIAGPNLQMAYQGISNNPTDNAQIFSMTWTPYLGYLPVMKK